MFSCLKRDLYYYKDFLKEIERLDTSLLIKNINVFIPLFSENINISPKLYNEWSDEQKEQFNSYLNIFIFKDSSIPSINSLIQTTIYNLFQD